MRSIEVDLIFEKHMGHFLDVFLDLEVETLSESRFFNARSDHMGFRS